jgi:hypothetical protein
MSAEPLSLLRRVASVPDEAGILLVGSAREGFRYGADTDFLVLLADDEEIAFDEKGVEVVHRPTTNADDYVIFGDGFALNPEVVRPGRVARLTQAVEPLAIFGSDARELPDSAPFRLPLLQILELRLLSRLDRGLPLANEARVEEWRERMNARFVPHYWIVATFFGALDCLGSLDERRGDPAEAETLAVLVRLSAESLLMTGLACAGIVVYDVKYVPAHIRGLRERGEPLAPSLEQAGPLLFPEPESLRGDGYERLIRDEAVKLFRYVEQQPHLAVAAKILRPHCREPLGI